MSEDRLERIESQISELREMVQQNTQDVTAIQQGMTAMQQNINALREDVVGLRQRMDSIEGTVVITIREGFDSIRNYLDDLNYDLADNERKTRRLGRRVARLERREER